MKANEIAALAKKLKANGADLGDLAVNFDVAELEKMSDVGRVALAAALKALDKASQKAAAGEEDDPPGDDPAANEGDDPDPKDMKANRRGAQRQAPQAITVGQLATMIDKALDKRFNAMKADLLTAGRRADVTAKLLANQRNAFAESDLQAMSVEQLEKYEQSIRDVDYSGAAGGFAAHAGGDASPLVPPAYSPRKAAN